MRDTTLLVARILLVALMYLAMSLPMMYFIGRLERRLPLIGAGGFILRAE